MTKIVEESKVLGEIDAGDGRMVPHIRCRSETIIINKISGIEYDSEDHVILDGVSTYYQHETGTGS